VSEIEERHILEFIRSRTTDAPRPLAASTLRNILADLRRALNVVVDRGEIQRNPCRNLGRLLSRVERQQSAEVREADAWSRAEVATLLDVAEAEDPRFHPIFATLVYSVMRKGEVRALRWRDLDFDAGRIAVRRAYSGNQIRTPKNGKGRYVALAPRLASILRDLLATRRRQCLSHGWEDRRNKQRISQVR
jgi:integrase